MNNDLEQYTKNGFTDSELEFMAHGNNPVANAYRELLAFRRAAKQAKPTFEEWMSNQSEKIEVDCGCVTTEAFYHWLKVAYEATPQPAHTEQVIPDGWKLVPIEPTDEMFYSLVPAMARSENLNRDEYDISRRNERLARWVYKSLIAAAPKPESE